MQKFHPTSPVPFAASPAIGRSKGKITLAKALCASLLLSVAFTASSFATATLMFGEPSHATSTVADGSGSDYIGTTGVVGFSGTYNDFTINVIGSTAAGTPANPFLSQMAVTIKNNSASTETLQIYFSEIGFGPTSAVPTASFSASTNAGSVIYFTYADAGNTLFGETTSLTSQGPISGAFGTTSTTGPLVSLGSYSLEQYLQITLPAGGLFTGTTSLSLPSVPEQGASGVVLLGLALAGMEVLRRTLRRFSPV